MATIKDITTHLECLAPLGYQESYDNAGLLVGNPNAEVTGIIVSLDCTEDVIAEALQHGCNLVVAHHPIVFRGLKKITGKTYVERTIIKAIKHDVAIYATHTNLDNVWGGVNSKICQKLNLQDCKILVPKKDTLLKLVTFVPIESAELVLDSLYKAGAGQVGEYKNCSFRVNGTGTFMPTGEANPHIGNINKQEEVLETRIEVVFSAMRQSSVMKALQTAHPYEEIAYYLSPLLNDNQEVGSGAIGFLPIEMSEETFLNYLKNQMTLQVIRHTKFLNKPVHKIAVCGGAGGFLLNDAIRQGADVFITADYKYHEFFDADGQLMICDIGHYESEVFTKELILSYLTKKFANFAILLSDVNTNPVQYFV